MAASQTPERSSQRTPRASVRVAGLAAIALTFLALVELGAWAGIRYAVYPRDERGYYVVPEIDRAEYQSYLQRRDPELGWPPPDEIGGERYDATGSRPIPAFPEPGDECVSLYGDSFTYGFEVEHDEAWSNVLSEELDCRVANYGVGGYGTDQALMRFLANPDDAAPLTILGILPHDVMRNVNQQRYFMTAKNPLGMKPRFVLDDGELRRIPLPGFSYEEAQRAMRDPAAYFEHETFLPNGREGAAWLRFPYTGVVVRKLLSPRLRNWLGGRPAWMSFLEPGHRSQSLEIAAEIIATFAATAADRGKRSMVVIFPTASSLAFFRDNGVPPTRHLVGAAEAAGIDTLDLHAAIDEYLGEDEICRILTMPGPCIGHFSAEGNRVVAMAVKRHLDARASP